MGIVKGLWGRLRLRMYCVFMFPPVCGRRKGREGSILTGFVSFQIMRRIPAVGLKFMALSKRSSASGHGPS